MGPDYDRIERFVPEGDRRSKTTPVDLHDRWVIRLMRLCTELFGGATAYGRGVGAWNVKATRRKPRRRATSASPRRPR